MPFFAACQSKNSRRKIVNCGGIAIAGRDATDQTNHIDTDLEPPALVRHRQNQYRIKVFIIDALAQFDPEPLRPPLEKSAAVKIIHNAAFDAARLSKHYNFSLAPIFDTMLAARRSGDRKYSLKAQAETHLAIRLDKSAQTSDWSRRPLDKRQLYYAALDPFATLLLYKNQLERGIRGEYRLKPPAGAAQNLLPLDDVHYQTLPVEVETSAADEPLFAEESSSKSDLSDVEIALLGIITELPTRYSPDALAASAGSSERVGLAGWIIDKRLSTGADPDEEEIKMAINKLFDRGFI